MFMDAFVRDCEALEKLVKDAEEELMNSKRAYAERRAVVDELNTAQDRVVALDVGGTRFHTTDATVRNHGTHMLSVLFGGTFADEEDESGAVFIDRDPSLFPCVLAYLRHGADHAWVSPADWLAVRREFYFFSLAPPPPPHRFFDVLNGPVLMSALGERYLGTSCSDRPLTGECTRLWTHGTYVLTLRVSCPCVGLGIGVYPLIPDPASPESFGSIQRKFGCRVSSTPWSSPTLLRPDVCLGGGCIPI
eukprot:TRINITY_DN5862_c0_g1_i1.p1 TRINITY_DN5862_c0_g1~~TRINITY_DN5862_c0_g1_i1.p1  ORF type:complete len:256 (+),score=25.46 TRINITY_DN5862_c0_g1_i1:26-769(+)